MWYLLIISSTPYIFLRPTTSASQPGSMGGGGECEQRDDRVHVEMCRGRRMGVAGCRERETARHSRRERAQEERDRLRLKKE